MGPATSSADRAQVQVGPNECSIVPFKAAIKFRYFDQLRHCAGYLRYVEPAPYEPVICSARQREGLRLCRFIAFSSGACPGLKGNHPLERPQINREIPAVRQRRIKRDSPCRRAVLAGLDDWFSWWGHR